MIVKEIMRNKIVTVDGNMTILDACIKYCDLRVGSLIVTEKNQFVGIVTENDFIERTIRKQKDPKTTKIKEIMSTGVKTIHPLDTVEKALNIMKENNIKKLPVISNNKLVGIITITDIAYSRPGVKNFLNLTRQ